MMTRIQFIIFTKYGQVFLGIALLLLLNHLQFGTCHLNRVFHPNENRKLIDGYAFRSYPKEGEAKSPLLQYRRDSRIPLFYSGESDGLSSPMRRHPPYTHRQLHLSSSSGISRFHPGTSSNMPLSQSLMISGSNSNGPKYHSTDTQHITEEDEDGGPTFTPYISARALTNMEKFFEHLRENLEALQKDEQEREAGRQLGSPNEDVSSSSDEAAKSIGSADRALASGYQLSPPTSAIRNPNGDWKSRESGTGLGLKKIRSFLPQVPENRNRYYGTNLGLG